MATYEPILDEVLVHTHPGEDVTGGNVGGAIPIRSVSFATNSSLPADVGQIKWDSANGTFQIGLTGNSVKLALGQEQVVRVVNKTTNDLSRSSYQVVRARRTAEGGAQGQRVAVLLAQANQELTSNDIIGLVAEDIAKNQEGFITISGQVDNINTTGSLQGETWSDGDILFLSPSIAGGLTNIEPQAPDHLVIIGYVEYAHVTQGKILVGIRNSWELDELHNVRIASASLATNQLLAYMPYNASISLWQNTNAANLSLTISPTFNPANTSSVNLIYSAPTLSASVNPSGIPHNSLASLQGGTIDEFFHLSGSLASIASRQANASLSGFLSFQDWYNFSNLISSPTLPLVVADSSSIDLAFGFPTLTASVLPQGIPHNSLASLQGGLLNEYLHITASNASLLARTSGTNTGDITVTDSASIDFTLTGQALTAVVLPGGITHNSLASIQGGTTNEYFHLSGTLATIASRQANGSLSGYLSSSDWTNFSNLISTATLTLTVSDTSTIDLTLTGTTLSGQVLLTGIPHGSLASLQGGVIGEYFHLSATLATVASRQANGSLSGFLTGTDWTTFNTKQNALTFPLAANLGGTGVNNGTNNLTVSTNSGTVSFTNASTTLTVANTASVSGTNTGDVTLATNSGLSITNQVLNMGTPSTITSSTTNSVTTSTHTHAITAGLGFIGNGTAQNQLPVTGATPFTPVWTAATGTGAPVLANTPTFVTKAIFPVGSAAAPSITWSGDTTTGMYSTGAGQFSISNNGVQEVIFGPSSMQLGYDALINGYVRAYGNYNEAATDIGVYLGSNSATNARILFCDGTASENWQIDNDAGLFRWYVPSYNMMRLTRLGTGTTTRPQVDFYYNNGSFFQISDTGILLGNRADQSISWTATAAGTGGRSYTIKAGSTTAGTANINGGTLNLDAGLGTGSGTSDIVFRTGNANATTTAIQTLAEKMRIRSSGNVGIGTTAPTSLLHVVDSNATAADTTTVTVDSTQSVSGVATLVAYRAIGRATHTTGTLTGLQSNSTQAFFTGSGGTTTYGQVLTSTAQVGTGHTVSNLDLMLVYTPTITGTATVLTGLRVQNITGGGTNYSIYTEGGTQYFTGATTQVGNLTISAADIITDGTTGTKVATATTQKLAFHGSTPVVQRASANQAAVATTGATNTTPYGYTTAAQANAIVTLVNEIRAALVEKGIIKGSA